MEVGERPKRLDARRNREAVLDAATELLGREPSASMQEIADASGLGRTTVYRHFTAREDLFEAMFERAIARAWAIAERILAAPTPAEETLQRLGAELIDMGAEFQFLLGNQAHGKPALQRGRESPQSPVRRYLAAAQERGELREDLPVQWMMSMFQALTVVAIEDELAGHVDHATAQRLLGQALLDTLLAPAR